MFSNIKYKIAAIEDFSVINKLYDEVGFVHSHPNKDIVIIGKNNDEIIALGRIVKIDNDNAELGGMYVKDEWRSHGIANSIVTRLLEISKDYKFIFCLPFQRLLNFYMKFGFIKPKEHNIPIEIVEKHKWCNSQYTEAVELLVLDSNHILEIVKEVRK